jgi:hypothetical protein
MASLDMRYPVGIFACVASTRFPHRLCVPSPFQVRVSGVDYRELGSLPGAPSGSDSSCRLNGASPLHAIVGVQHAYKHDTILPLFVELFNGQLNVFGDLPNQNWRDVTPR